MVIDAVVITESDSALSISSLVSNLGCYQDSSGSISIVATGGIGNYTYSWSNGETTPSLNNIGAATYTVDVIDSANCIVTETFIVTEPALLQHVLSYNDISCFGLSDGSSNILVSGGTAPYSYNWNGPSNYSSTNSNIDLLFSGMYYIAVNDGNGCILIDSVNIIEPLPLVTVVSSTDPLCYNSSDGSITVNVEGGNAPYTSNYGIINPTNIIPGTILYQNLSSGTEILSVFDANNCENSYTITLINPLDLVIDNLTTNDPSCYNYANGIASINAIGGTLPYTYQLLDQDNNILTGSSSNSNLQFGDYKYVVVDENACDDTVSFTINNPAEISIVPKSVVDINCFGDNTGLLSVDVNNYIGSYEIVWSPIEYNSDSTSIINLRAGKYDAVVIDELGCTKLDSFFVLENDEITASISAVNATCKLNADGQISIDNISGGIGPYNIYNNSVLVDENITNFYTIESLITTDDLDPYTLLITDSYDCQFTTKVNISYDGGYACVNEPVIITPNFDGYNDQWIPILDLDIEIEVDILNRWGQKEFRYSGNSLSFSWNGKANWGGESDLPSADYYYIIKFNNGEYPAKTGVITLIR
jgi:gliding motility-associated-like protein